MDDQVFVAYCTGQDLSSKKCVPCESKDLRPMTEDAANILIRRVPEWDLVNEGGSLKLHRSWKVKTFVKGMEFLRLVADLAEAEGHHPDLHLVGWNNIKIDIWTHALVGHSRETSPIFVKATSGSSHRVSGYKYRDMSFRTFESGLTENDFILAAKISRLDLHNLLRITPSTK
ncbi:hypothetical protein OROGR_012689 [Orobanche gracilis]